MSSPEQDQAALLAKFRPRSHAERLLPLRGHGDALLRIAVDQAATLDMAPATVEALRTVIDDAAILLRTGRRAEAAAPLLRVRAGWAGRPKPAYVARRK
jgi:hypothetical protein